MLTKPLIASLSLLIASEAFSACSNLGELFKRCGVVPQMAPSKLTCRGGIATFEYMIENSMEDSALRVRSFPICHEISLRRYGVIPAGEELNFERGWISRHATKTIYPSSSVSVSCEFNLNNFDDREQGGVFVVSWFVPIIQSVLYGADHYYAFYANGIATIEIRGERFFVARQLIFRYHKVHYSKCRLSISALISTVNAPQDRRMPRRQASTRSRMVLHLNKNGKDRADDKETRRRGDEETTRTGVEIRREARNPRIQSLTPRPKRQAFQTKLHHQKIPTRPGAVAPKKSR
jgi:hypothetical protein